MRPIHAMCHWFLLALAVTALSSNATSQHPTYHWIEGEAASHNFADPSWLSASEIQGASSLLSNGAWLTHVGPIGARRPRAEWTIDLPTTASYQLHVRKFWKHGPFEWWFDDGARRTCGPDVALLDSVPLPRQHVVANWVALGEVTLTAGKHRLQVELLGEPGTSVVAAFDAFVLTRGDFHPRGKLRPDMPVAPAEPGWWAFDPGPEPQTEPLVDLRALNESSAGSGGPIRRQGGQLVRGDGAPMRLFGVNLGIDAITTDATIVRSLVRRLASYGVNLIRFHGALFDQDQPGVPVDPTRLAALHTLQDACRVNGVYLALSLYFPLWLPATEGTGFTGYPKDGSGRPFGALFFDEHLQGLHQDWFDTVLGSVNPHLGIKVAADPSLAFVEIVNEDSLLFWTFARSTIPPVQWARLELAFGSHLTTRYGSLTKALGNLASHRDDAPAQGRAGLDEAWHMTRDGFRRKNAKSRRRIEEQIRFLVEQQRSFFERTRDRWQQDHDLKALIICGNWKTADPVVLDPLEQWINLAGDVLDHHGYFGGRHEGPRAAYAVDVGDTYSDRSWTREPSPSPLQVVQIEHVPQVISELGWPAPNRFRAEMAPLAVTYAAVQGIDGLMLFAVDSPVLLDASMSKFSVTTPATLLTFPAAAWMYRRFDIQTPPAAMVERRSPGELFNLRGTTIAPAPAFDALRAVDVLTVRRDGLLDPRVFALGPVLRRMSPGKDEVSPAVAGLVGGGVVRSPAGVQHDTRGLVTIDVPRSRGAIGFLDQFGEIELSGLTIEAGFPYGTVLVVSLDDRVLEESERILVQVVAEDRPRGFSQRDGKVEALGGFPFELRCTPVRLRTGFEMGRYRVTALDPYLCARGDVAPVEGAGVLDVRLVEDAAFHLIERL